MKKNFKYYMSNKENIPSDKTIEIFLNAREFDNSQLAMLIKGLIDRYVLNSDYAIESFILDDTESEKYNFFISNTKNIEAIEFDKIDTKKRTKDLFYKQRAYNILNSYKTKMIFFLYILTSILLYYLCENIFIIIIYIISTIFVEIIINKKVSNRVRKKAKKDIDEVYNKTE